MGSGRLEEVVLGELGDGWAGIAGFLMVVRWIEQAARPRVSFSTRPGLNKRENPGGVAVSTMPREVRLGQRAVATHGVYGGMNGGIGRVVTRL